MCTFPLHTSALLFCITQSETIESKSMVRSLFELIKLSTNVNIVSSGNEQKKIPNILGSEVRAVQNAIKARIGDPSDVPVKEFITLAMLKCQEKSSDPNFQSFSVSQIASVVDSSYSIFKIGYHLANGSVKASDMTEYLIDRSVARVEALIHNACIHFGKKAGAAVGKMVGSKLGPVGAKVGNFVGAAIGGMVGKTISNMISIGIQKIVPVAKEKINRFFEKATSKLSSFNSNLMSWIRG